MVISELLRRDDRFESNGARTNATIRDMCKEEDMKHIEHEKINTEHHNGSFLHLNKYGDSIF